MEVGLSAPVVVADPVVHLREGIPIVEDVHGVHGVVVAPDCG